MVTGEEEEMDVPEISSIDGLLEHLGVCGLFQVMVVIFIHGAIIASPWSMMFMAYGNYNPGWTCQDPPINLSSLINTTGEHFINFKTNAKGEPFANFSTGTKGKPFANSSTDAKGEESCDAFDRCQNVKYSTEASTIVTEWNLACDGKWITSLMISLQMCGVLIGALLSGQLNLVIGRKACLYGSLSLHAVFNLIASFSVHWPMFAVFRFFLGITCGSIMLCGFVFPMEFVTNSWRGVVAALPFSSTGNLTFALVAMLLKDWRHLHWATAALAVILMLPAIWTPNSVRWLALKDKTYEAEKVGLQIAKVNRKPPVSMDVIKVIAETERKIEESKPHFTILDLYRHGFLFQTLVLTFAWLTNTIIYYAFIYDVQALSGNFFVNLMIFSLLTFITLPFVPLLTNTVGRKWGIIIPMVLASVACLLLVIMNFVETGIDKGVARLCLVLIITILVDAEWAVVQLYCVELYPTVLRSLSYSNGSCVSRIGGMIAPFLIPRTESTAYISQLVMLGLIAAACVGTFFLPETKGKHLEESVLALKRTETKRKNEEKTENDMFL